MDEKVYAFDLGKASMGFCARNGFEILDVGSVIIDKDHSEVISNRDRRRAFKTLNAHKNRVNFFIDLWQSCGLELLDKSDKRFTIEFSKKNDETIYNSALLRIAVLQNKKLEQWQIYKALHSAIQRRGYDPNLEWAKNSDDEKKNEELACKYMQSDDGHELITNDEYKYPCYYDALRLGLWSESSPNTFNRCISLVDITKVRTAGLVAPRKLVEKELTQLFLNAQKQLPELKKYSVDYFLYGKYRKAYITFRTPAQGREKDYGVLGQKIPRFDNRIIAKCKLLPKRNVCKAETFENVSFTLLMKLKNLRVTASDGQKLMLTSDEIKKIYNNWLEESNNGEKLNTTITKTKIEKVLGCKILDDTKNINETMKANLSGRSSFCRRACQIMNKIILEGIENPVTMDVVEFIDNIDTPNSITESEIREMLGRVGTWKNLHIPDNRYEMLENSTDDRRETDLIIGSITNPIVRNRLQILRDKLLELKSKHGTPDKVIFEFVRDGADNSLYGAEKANAYLKILKNNEKKNEDIRKELEDVDAYTPTNFEKLKLLKMQGMKCIYSGKPISVSDFDKCEIDHIYPRTLGGNDALYNRVLCYSIENQKKAGRTPYEWLSKDEEIWSVYIDRLTGIKNLLGKKKFELLTSNSEECKELIDSYNGLAETAQIARIAQKLAGFIFGFGMQTKDSERHLFVNNGATTAAIRRRYGLNKILGEDVKKNRENDKHHALDAICISFSQDFKYDEKSGKDIIEGFTYDFVKNAIDEIIPYPYTNKKPFKGNTRPLETIYGYKKIGETHCITNRVDLTTFEQKEKKIKTILDESIKNDLLKKLTVSKEEWNALLKNYIHPTKRTQVKKVKVIVSEGDLTHDINGRMRIGEFVDFGNKGTIKQFKHSKGHKGQILYYNEKGTIKVMPIYANQKTEEVKEKLQEMNCKLYKKGMMFYSGCLVDIPKDFNAGKNTCPAGIYKLRTIIADTGVIKLESSIGAEILTSAKYLSKANFSRYKD